MTRPLDTCQDPLSGKRLLYVENDPLDVMALQRGLSALGSKPDIAISDSAEQALVYLQDCQSSRLPDAMILDLRMPGLGGMRLLKLLNENEVWSQIPTIVFSTSDRRSEISAAKAAGASDYLVKRMDDAVYAELVASIQRLTAAPIN